MTQTDLSRLFEQQRDSRFLALSRLLARLGNVQTFMQSGAHPDDEISDLMALLAIDQGYDISYVCSTRGEGGQNALGSERTGALGVLRTAEMEDAARSLNMRLYWMCDAPDDPLADFGFSKNGEDTMARWGHDRVLQTFVHAVRRDRPDHLCTTFLDVPGQHGHHRAMTQAAHEVFTLAADPVYQGSDLPPWQIGKLFLPAWSGAGLAYDDDLPPPPQTHLLQDPGGESHSGWSFANIGQHSRLYHQSQGMGTWAALDKTRDFPLHLAACAVDDSGQLASGLPKRLADIGGSHCASADTAIDDAQAAFPDYAAVSAALVKARQHLSLATNEVQLGHTHRVALKRRQIDAALQLAEGIAVHASIAKDTLRPGKPVAATLGSNSAQAKLSWALPQGWKAAGETIIPPADSAGDKSYPGDFDPMAPPLPHANLTFKVQDQHISVPIEPEVRPQLLPAVALDGLPGLLVQNRTVDTAPLTFQLPAVEGLSADAPAGWDCKIQGTQLTATPPPDIAPGTYQIALSVSGTPAMRVQKVKTPLTPERALVTPATLEISIVEAALPKARVGYIGGGNDGLLDALAQFGMAPVEITDEHLGKSDPFVEFDTIVIGVFAFRTRSELSPHLDALHSWVRAGGTLTSFYHRPWDNWDAETTPTARLTIGQPSLRWRVTDPTAPIDVLAPDHPLMNTPNALGADTWDGWRKERGLYFGAKWDDSYTALLAINDPGEAPLHGALLSADIGKGRHTHIALSLHTQLEAGHPGAFKLFANVLA